MTDLRALALAARAANDPNRAASLWRQLLDRAPEDWRLALELKRDLKAGWHYPDSDPWFRRAARHLPDAEWLAHYAALYAYHGSDLAAIDSRARALLHRWPGDARLEAILGDVARQRRDWTEAVRAFDAAAHADPTHPEYARKAAAARLYARLAAQPWHETGPAYPIALINLDRNGERMVEIDRQFAASAPPRRRIPGVEGSRLPSAAIRRLAGERALGMRGTLGCFLSHAAAWEALAASKDPAWLIVEDDVIPLLDLPGHLGALPFPDGWDILFVNDRLEPKRNPADASGFTTQTLAETMAAFDPEDNAPGADGYFLSARGARLLLDWIAADGLADDVDWRLLAYALSPADIAAIPAHAHARRELDRLRTAVPRTDRLQAHVLYPALIRTVGVSSDREDQNRIHG